MPKPIWAPPGAGASDGQLEPKKIAQNVEREVARLGIRASRIDREDVAQEVCLALLTTRTFSRPTHPPAYLRAVCRNVIIDGLRRRNAAKRSALLVAIDEVWCKLEDRGLNPEERLLRIEDGRRLSQAIRKVLPEHAYRVFSLRYFRGLSVAAIAATLGLTVSTVNQILYRARARLRLARARTTERDTAP